MQRRWSRRHMTHRVDSTKIANWISSIPEQHWAAMIKQRALPFHTLREELKTSLEACGLLESEPSVGLRTPAEAARKLHCSIKTLNGHVAAGDLRYVIIGKGMKRPRRMFADDDLDEFITTQSRKDVPCPSTRTRARHTSNLISSGEVIAFTAQPRP